MKKLFKKYLLIAIVLLMLFLLSSINRSKPGTCCLFSRLPGIDSNGAANE